jgi:hypothetical protein
MARFQYTRLSKSQVYEAIDEKTKKRFLIQQRGDLWLLLEDFPNFSFLGNYESLERAQEALERIVFFREFANILPWESMANGGTK